MEHELRLVDPRTGQARGAARRCRADEIAAAVATARTALPDWASLTPRARSARLAAFAGLIEEHAAGYAAAEQAGTGKPPAEAQAEVAEAVDLFRYYAWAARTQATPAGGALVDGHESWIRWEPIGVVAAVVPWNYPLMMAAWRCAPALAAGNPVLLKPANTTPDTALLLAEHAREALGDGVLQCVPGDRQTGRELVLSELDAVAFTGSVTAGADVAARAGVRRVSLELGGNAPVIVLPDADPRSFAAIADAATYNAGQSCAAPARVITLTENYDDVVSSLAAAMTARVAGRDFGPLNNPDQVARYDRITGATAGSVAATGKSEPGSGETGGFWRPTVVLADLPDDDPAVTEEVFAPVLTVQRAQDLQDAVRLANSQPQALAASVWSNDLRSAISLAGQLNAGEAWVNCHLVQTAELPHGGRGASGHGTDLSVLALHEYQRPKTVTARIAW